MIPHVFQRNAAWPLWVAALVASVSVAAARPVRIFVAPDGDDQWSGRRAAVTRGRTDGPVRSVGAALATARGLRQGGQARDGIEILLRGGRYELDRPLTITPEDSGPSPRSGLLIAPYRDENPVLSGGRRVTGWRPVERRPGVWQTTIGSVRSGDWYFRQLFINGERRQRARTPNSGYFRIQGESPQERPVRIRYKAGEVRPEWAADGNVELIALLAWADLRMQIRGVDEGKAVATLSGNPQRSNQENNAQYYIENTPDALDQPGEWYLDRRTGTLTYWALATEDPNTAEVVAPVLTELLRLEGDLAGRRPVRHVTVRGLTFAETDWRLGPEGYADTQAAVNVEGDVRAEAAVDCAFEDCRFVRLGGYALELGRGAQRIRVVGNEVFDAGAGGVRVGETVKRSEAFEANHGHSITDNHLHRLGRVYPAAVGVFVLQSGGNRIAHNHIHDLFYTAVSVGWNWGYQETPCRENVVEFNHLHDIGQSLLSDMGAVYTLGIQRGTVIRNNLIHDVNAFTYGGWGLYTDEGSTDIRLENNVVFRTKSAGFHQHYGRDNIVRNNVFAYGKENQLMRSRAEPHNSFFFTNNVVYYDSGNLLGSNWSNDNYVMDGNVYFNARKAGSGAGLEFGGATLEAWRRRGHDQHSIIADPRFVDAARFDFRLRPDSPALKLGIKSIDVSKVGPRTKSERR